MRHQDQEASAVPTPRALTFGSVAEAYDRFRPTYPPRLAADVAALAPGRRFVEVGAGTGKATAVFAAHDLDLTCVEPDAEMAAVLSRRFTGDPRVRVVVSTFEQWRPDGLYDALTCAQAWHWTDPQTRWRHAAEALRPGGVIALFWNTESHRDPALGEVVDAVYARYGITDRPEFRTSPLDRDDDRHRRHDAADAAGLFSGFETRWYTWERRESVADLVGRFDTVSAHLILPGETREALSRDLLLAITDHTGGEVTLAMDTVLALARRDG
ncbi:MAG TPA: class I SAM-dependent methyltransferase [Micromonosporaceae bacterium]|nr:class I SAM-dependent methyltransferase [Micromonosporaceae bacterium]